MGALIDIGRTSFGMLSKIGSWSFGRLRSKDFVEMYVEEVAETFGWRRCLKRRVGRWYNDDNVEAEVIAQLVEKLRCVFRSPARLIWDSEAAERVWSFPSEDCVS
ncbi:MAG: hypothetical protein ACTS80_00405 [Candidatus Hodgkinia cicadicola]